MTADDLFASPLLALVVVAVALATKLIGCGGAALACGESAATSLRVGAGMVGRGEIALVVASVGLSSGLVDQRVFSIAIVMTIVTTIAAPLLLKVAYTFTPARKSALDSSPALVPEYLGSGQ